MRHYSDKKMEPSTSSQPSGGGTGDDVATEVQRTNRLLEIENMDWQRQLKQAVSVPLFYFDGLPFLSLNSPFPDCGYLCHTGF